MNARSSKYYSPRTLAKLPPLRLRAREAVEGYLAGIHRSPLHGRSVEFLEHRPYSPGTDLKYIDWRLWARTDRFYVKLFEQETNVRAYLLVDGSGSMAFGSGPTGKFEMACVLAASLAYLLLAQQDAVALQVLRRPPGPTLPPSASPAQLEEVCNALERVSPAGPTAGGEALMAAADRMRPRSLAVLVSDMFIEPQGLERFVQRLRYDGHGAVFIQVLDPQELEFPFRGNVRFEDVEGGPALRTDASRVRRDYLEALGRFQKWLERLCRDNRVDYVLATTDQQPHVPLVRLLGQRQ